MGKKLIIKGADFSVNGIIGGQLTFINDYTDAVLHGDTVLTSANTFYIKPSEITRLGLDGQTITYVKLYVYASGTLNIGTVNNAGTTITQNTSVQVEQGVNIIKLTNPITINSSHLPCFTVTGGPIITYWTGGDASNSKGFEMLRANSSNTYPNNRFPISFGSLVSPN